MRFLLSLFIFFNICMPLFAKDDDPEKSLMKGIVYTADNIEYLKAEKVVIGTGNVKVVVEDENVVLTADKVTIDLYQKMAYAEGNAALKQQDRILKGNNITFDFLTKQGFVDSAKVFVQPWSIYGKNIEKDPEDNVFINNGYMSTCPLDEPHWRITAKKMEIYPGDKIVARNVVVYIGSVPIFYWPKFSDSLKDRRGNISLVPGRTSDWGEYIFSGYRYEFKDNVKGEFKLDYRKKKGWAYGWDQRYQTNDSAGIFRVYYLDEHDKGVDPTTSRARHRFKWTHKQNFNDNLWGVMEWHELSDQDIIKDYIEREYQKYPSPDSYVYLQNKFPQYNLNLYASKQTNSFLDTVEYQPEISLYTNYINIPQTNFYYHTEGSAANLNFEKIDKDDSINRMDLYQELGYAGKIKDLSIHPYAGVRETYFSEDLQNQEEIRGALYSGVDFRMKFHKTIDCLNDFWDVDDLRIVHEPSVNYTYIHNPTVDKDSLHQFDDVDSLDKENIVRFKLESRLQTRRFRKSMSDNWNIMRHEIYVDYYPDGIKQVEAVRDISDIYQKFEFTPFDWLKFDMRTRFDPYYKHYDEAKFDMTLDAKEKGSLLFSHHYRREEDSDLLTRYKFNITDKWSAAVSTNYDFNEKRMDRQEYTIIRDLHCWMTAFTFAQEKDELKTENEFWVVFYLKAFADDAFDFSDGVKGVIK